MSRKDERVIQNLIEPLTGFGQFHDDARTDRRVVGRSSEAALNGVGLELQAR